MAYSRTWPLAAGEQDQGMCGAVGESPCAHPGTVISFLLLQLPSQLQITLQREQHPPLPSAQCRLSLELAGTALGQRLLAEIKGIL